MCPVACNIHIDIWQINWYCIYILHGSRFRICTILWPFILLLLNFYATTINFLYSSPKTTAFYIKAFGMLAFKVKWNWQFFFTLLPNLCKVLSVPNYVLHEWTPFSSFIPCFNEYLVCYVKCFQLVAINDGSHFVTCDKWWHVAWPS